MRTLSESTLTRGVLLVSAAAVVFLTVWYAFNVLLTIFGGILFAVFLRGLADLLARRTGISQGRALAAVVVLLALIICGGLVLIVPRVAAQLDEFLNVLPRTIDNWVGQLRRYEWGQWIIRQVPQLAGSLLGKLNIMSLVAGALRATVFVVVVAFIGIYVGGKPEWYREGALRVLPPAKRARARALLDSVGETMRWWMIGRAIAMMAVGLLDFTGLVLIGFPLAISIAVLSGVLTFVPYVGAMLSLIPALMIALGVNPMMAVWVFVIHTAVQTVEGYVITPMVQRRAVHMPPALTLAAQFFMGEVAGVLGLMFATPLAAIALVLLDRLYFHTDND